MLAKIKENKRNYFTVLGIGIVFSILFFRTYNFEATGITKRGILGFIICCLVIIVFPVLFTCLRSLNNFVDNRYNTIFDAIDYAKENKKKVLIWLALFIVGGPGVILIFRRISPNPFVGYTICSVIYVLLFVVIYSKKSGIKPEGLFACLAITIGSFAIMVTPAVPGISTDDEIHYMRAVSLADYCGDVYYVAERSAIDRYGEVILAKHGYSKESRDKYYAELNTSYDMKQLFWEKIEDVGSFSIAYVPSALGIIIGKGLDLSFTNIFKMGKFFNLLIYVIVMYYAIKRLRYGKVLFAVMGLIPSNIFLASSYAYDSWVFAFMALGFAYYFSMLQDDKQLETKDAIFMFLFFLMGIIPKAVYIVLLFPLFYMPKYKFKSSKQRLCYYGCFVAMALLLFASMIVPRFFVQNVSGDIRGGSDVSISGQIEFIFSDFGRFLRILFTFLQSYLSLEESRAVVQFYAYLGNGKHYIFVIVILFVVAFLDRDDEKRHLLPMKIMAIIGAFAGAMLVATALYIDFTPVGHNTINGCQPRYILPLLIPVLYSIVPEGICTRGKKNWLANVSMALLALSFVNNIFELSVKLFLPV